MPDYRELPPIDFDDYVTLGVGITDTEETLDESNTCIECEVVLPYTYRVVIPSICSHCLQQHSLPAGARATRNTRDISDFVKPSPPGYHWDYETQSHIPDAKPEPPTTIVDETPGGYYARVTPNRAYTFTVGGGGSGSGGGGVSSFRTSGSYTDAPNRDDPRNWSPKQINEYLTKYYTPDELRMQYSELRQSLMYGTPGTYEFHEAPKPEPESEILSIHLPHSNLTGRKDSAILNENDPKPEEQDMPMEHILSREEAEAAYKQAAAALARLKELEEKYCQDLSNGSVIAFKLAFPSRASIYSYAAVKAAGLWFPTGRVHPSYSAGVGLEWTTLLSGLEQFQATEFEVLRTGGEVQEIEADRTIVLPPGSVTTAFNGDPGDDPETEDDLAGRQSGKYPEGS